MHIRSHHSYFNFDFFHKLFRVCQLPAVLLCATLNRPHRHQAPEQLRSEKRCSTHGVKTAWLRDGRAEDHSVWEMDDVNAPSCYTIAMENMGMENHIYFIFVDNI